MMSKQRLKSLLQHGNLKKVAETAGVSNAAVSKFFNDDTKSSHRIYKAALEVAIESNRDIKKLESQFEKVAPAV